jgi:hypothetical protein
MTINAMKQLISAIEGLYVSPQVQVNKEESKPNTNFFINSSTVVSISF